MRARWFAQHQAFLARQNLGSERSAAIGATSKGVRLALQSLVLGLGAWLAVEGLITPGMMIAGSILVISHDRWFLDRICTHILAAEGDSQWVFFDGNYQEYEADKKKRLGEEGAKPKRLRFKALK